MKHTLNLAAVLTGALLGATEGALAGQPPEVDTAYPELVIRDDTGEIQGVRYDELAPMLLNEVQQQRVELEAQQRQFDEVRQLQRQAQQERQELAAVAGQFRDMQQRVAVLEQANQGTPATAALLQ
jgi:hypothetical protein